MGAADHVRALPLCAHTGGGAGMMVVMSSPERVKVVVIGAGQAGLSVAYYLRRFELVADQDFVVLDRAPGPGGAWQHRWSSLRLGTAHRVNDLPGMSDLD